MADLNYTKVNEFLFWGSSPIDSYWKAQKNIPDKIFESQLQRDIHLLRKDLGVQHILSVKHTSPPPSAHQRFKTVLWIPVPDAHPPTLGQVAHAVSFIDTCMEASEACYVHCRFGLGRSTTLVAAWLIGSQGYSAAKAEAELERLRPAVKTGWTREQRDFLRAFAAK